MARTRPHEPRLRRLARVVVALLLSLAIALATAWACCALWFRLPLPEGARDVAAGLFALLGLVAIAAMFTRRRLPAGIGFLAALAAVALWWSTIEPPRSGDWAPDVARQVTGKLDGDLLTLTNMRDFDWRSETDFSQQWTTRTYDLSKLRTLDLYVTYWAGPEIAHPILSFGFEGGEYIAWSVEIRRPKTGDFSPLADAFKSDTLVVLASDERDIVRLRTNIRHERVELYRLKATPAQARALLLQYVGEANALAETPKFYNTLTTNCTTVIVKMIRIAGQSIAFNWRLIVNGYLPEYIYERGVVDTSLPLAELRAASHIEPRALAAGDSVDFSRLIRVGLRIPGP
jgi:Domain of unknown function (DUF4105)